ncbi:sigma-B regulation protein RsbU (phosphoserine phosphatase) [Methanolinea mesophila]|uniref:SpoIIE family protein phosphatase n=1 Tax=Methanolinea mesophila TaxID=547055 RepID=UPI001AE1A424|nr:SpoIIE family protein phosphatase [Methanolinea mesophila]MBP1929757.1 sigma-B regulation protein RsbU (phosphoserine phosphatase) [Methanolinea mesophila]
MRSGKTAGNAVRISVRTKILLVFLALSVSALLVTGLLAFVQMGDVSRFAMDRSDELGSRAMNDSTAALEQDARDSLLRLAKDQAYISNIVFEQVNGEIDTMAYYAGELQTDPSMVRERHFYLQDEPPDDIYSTTVLFLAPGAEADIPLAERNAAGMMDDIFIPVYHADPHLAGVYVGTESGMSMIYPWVTGLNASFDPRMRGWFTQAKESGSVTWSEPYVDLLGHGLMVTCSKPVNDPESGWFWVIGADVTIETINQNIIGTQVGNRGYAMLIDQHGNVITRPGLSSGDMRWDESFVTENLLDSANPGLVAVTREMINGRTGIARVMFEDGERFIAYAPVESVNWSVAVVMPVEEVIAPALSTRESILAASEDTASHIGSQQEMMRTIFSAMFLVLLAVVGVLTLIFSRYLTRPLEDLKRGSEAIGRGDLEYTVEVHTGDEFEDLADSFNHMAADLREHVATLRRTTAEKERILKELEIAKGIQQSFLPDAAPVLPGIDLQGFNLPAAEVGGDFYDFIPVGEEHWGLVIADVSGKGVPAALFMALSRTLIRASAAHNPDPAESIREANRNIYLDSKTSMFVTLFYAILDPREKSLTFVNAGHNPPLLFGTGNERITLLKAKGIALGVLDEIELESVEVNLKPGDIAVLYTDGVTEAANEQDEEYGVARLEKIVELSRHLSSRGIIDAVVQDVRAFAGNRPQFDDITLMVLKIE